MSAADYSYRANDVMFLAFVNDPDKMKAQEMHGTQAEKEDKSNPNVEFNPTYTHQILSENQDDENIYGYKGLKIKLFYSPACTKSYLSIKWDDKLKDATPSDFNEVFKKHFNENFQPTKNFDEFLKGCKDEMEHFQPPGKMIAQFKHYGKNIEIYNGNFCDDEECKKYNRQIQLFTLLFIDGASYVDEDEYGWSIMTMYQHETHYQLIGFLLYYRFYAYPSHERRRISHFLVFPPHERRGLGGRLYDTFRRTCGDDDAVRDSTVEAQDTDLGVLRAAHDVCEACGAGVSWRDLADTTPPPLKLSRKQARHCARIIVTMEVGADAVLKAVRGETPADQIDPRIVWLLASISKELSTDLTVEDFEDIIEQFKDVEMSVKKLKSFRE